MHFGKMRFMYMRQDHVLLMADAQLVMAKALRQFCQHPHLRRCGIAWRCAMSFERDGDDRVLFALMGVQVGVGPSAKHRIAGARFFKNRGAAFFQKRRCELRGDFIEQSLIHAGKAGFEYCKTLLHQRSDFLKPVLVHRDLDPRFIFVVAPPEQVVDADDGFQIGQQILARNEIGDDLAKQRRAP